MCVLFSHFVQVNDYFVVEISDNKVHVFFVESRFEKNESNEEENL